jgi:NAD(P)-dependent dehydrogenase (short-subunit alcohol dehydrogenase family)
MGYADQLLDLTDRVVLVTGGSSGLGREMAFAAAHCGADVVIASRNLESCQATAAEITAATGRTALAHEVHVGRWDQLDGLVDAAAHAALRRGEGRIEHAHRGYRESIRSDGAGEHPDGRALSDRCEQG